MTEPADLPLEISLLNFLRTVSNAQGDRLNALAARLGWTGRFPASLDECGKLLGVTRERMRQIQNKFTNQIRGQKISMPKLDEALILLEKRTPVTLDRASEILQQEGVTLTRFHLQSLLNAAHLLDRPTPLRVCRTKAGSLLVKGDTSTLLQSISLIPMFARRLAAQSGIASVSGVQEALVLGGHILQKEYLRRMLNEMDTLDFIDNEWFWSTDVKNNRNRLYNISRKILAVRSPQYLPYIHQGVTRAYHFLKTSSNKFISISVAPLEIMKIFFEKHGHFAVEGDLVYSTIPLDYTRELGHNDCIFVHVLRSSHHGVLDRTNFAAASIAKGMKKNTFNTYLTRSCILEKVGIDHWKLRGTILDSGVTECCLDTNRTDVSNPCGISIDGNFATV